MTLSSPQAIVTKLIASLNLPVQQDNDPDQPPSNPLSTTTYRKELLTLHVLFPNALLPALDLLDRGLVTKLRLREEPSSPPHIAIPNDTLTATPQVFYARSAATTNPQSHQQHHRRHPSPPALGLSQPSHHEVRLNSWTCTCPAFTFSAFPAPIESPPGVSDAHEDVLGSDGLDDLGGEWRAGGMLTRASQHVPMCKHLLACVLVEYTGLFRGRGLFEREVSSEEAAGWAAGWGD